MKSFREIRNDFIEFFKERDHEFVPSSSLILKEDPTLLFANAGMNQFKDVFLGKGTRPYKRAVNSQKCIRVSGKHNDLEEVGVDTYHHTFFEMLGNWSFGDYYKEEAIKWAWELLTEVWGIDKNRLYATYYKDDEETKKIWARVTDIDKSRILPFGEKDNFWEMADTGPCGPCTEIHIDLGEDACSMKDVEGHKCEVNGKCGRFVEIWNLVFIQYNRKEDRTLEPLKNRFVDTGMGFERIVSVLQGKKSNYDTDIFRPLIEWVENESGVSYEEFNGVPHRVIADHIRSLTFAIADGAIPSNEGRGYVLRRILRRSLRQGHIIGLKKPFLYRLSSVVVDNMGDFFPELKERHNRVSSLIKSEEERFLKTLDKGISLFMSIKEELEKKGEKIISGNDVFKLYDTYGFPVDMTSLMAKEEGLEIDEEGFQKEMKKQRERSRKARKNVQIGQIDWIDLNDGKSVFVGYEKYETDTVILKYASEKNGIYVILKETPFYAESGGQVADTGYINGESFSLKVFDVQKSSMGNIHICEIVKGEISDEKVNAKIDINRRFNIMRNHTATHLLHSALRKILGDKVYQEGSYVGPDMLRFDFSYHKPLTDEEIFEIEKWVNTWILNSYDVKTEEMPIDEAKKKGAIALFGEKYGDIVRVVSAGDVSIELCGGTHLKNTSQIGSFFIVSSSAVAAGIRRVECITGMKAWEKSVQWKGIVNNLKEILKIKEDKIEDRVEELMDKNKEIEKEIELYKKKLIAKETENILNSVEKIGNIFILKHNLGEIKNRKDMKLYADEVRKKLQHNVCGVIYAKVKNGAHLVMFVSKDLSDKINASQIIKEVGLKFDIKGGGRPELAECGIKDESIVGEFADAIINSVKENI